MSNPIDHIKKIFSSRPPILEDITPEESGAHRRLKAETRSFSDIFFKSNRKSETRELKKIVEPIKLNKEEQFKEKFKINRRSFESGGPLSDISKITEENVVSLLEETFGFAPKTYYIKGYPSRELIRSALQLEKSGNLDLLAKGLYLLAKKLKDEAKRDRFYGELFNIAIEVVKEDTETIALQLLCMYCEKDLKIFPTKLYVLFKREPPESLFTFLRLTAQQSIKEQKSQALFRNMCLNGALSLVCITYEVETDQFLRSLKQKFEDFLSKTDGSEFVVNFMVLEGLRVSDPQKKAKANKNNFIQLCVCLIAFITKHTFSANTRKVIQSRYNAVCKHQEYKDLASAVAAGDLLSLRLIGPYLSTTLGANIKYLNSYKRSVLIDLSKVFQKFVQCIDKEIPKEQPANYLDSIFFEVLDDLKESFRSFIAKNSSV